MDELLSLHDDPIFLRREAISAGYHDKDLQSALRDGLVVRIRHGAYASAAIWAAATDVERHLMAASAVVLGHAEPVALCGVTAALAHGLRADRPDLRSVHVLRLSDAEARTRVGVAYHRVPRVAVEALSAIGDCLVVPATVAALEAAGVSSVRGGVVILDSLLDRRGITRDDLVAAYAAHRGRPHSRRLRLSVALAREGSQSVGESLARYLMSTQHVPEPVLQYEVRSAAGKLLGISDFAWPELGALGEFDGRVKYERYLRDGETASDAVFREKAREDRLRAATGFLVVRLTWDDLTRERETGRMLHEFLRRAGALVDRGLRAQIAAM